MPIGFVAGPFLLLHLLRLIAVQTHYPTNQIKLGSGLGLEASRKHQGGAAALEIDQFPGF
jgi:hypothetical protein